MNYKIWQIVNQLFMLTFKQSNSYNWRASVMVLYVLYINIPQLWWFVSSLQLEWWECVNYILMPVQSNWSTYFKYWFCCIYYCWPCVYCLIPVSHEVFLNVPHIYHLFLNDFSIVRYQYKQCIISPNMIRNIL